MKGLVNKLYIYIRYSLSQEKKELDNYMKRIRNLDALTDADWVRLQELAQEEKNLLHPQDPWAHLTRTAKVEQS